MGFWDIWDIWDSMLILIAKSNHSSIKIRMKYILIGAFTSCFFFNSQQVKAFTTDTLLGNSIKKNFIEAELLGNSYLSPFFSILPSKYGLSLGSINYSRLVVSSNSCWQFSAGVGTFRSFYYENQGNVLTLHTPLALAIRAGFLWRANYKRNGLWVGLFFTSTYVKQVYDEIVDRNNSIVHTVYFDYQVMPNLCYQFSSKKEGFVCKIFLSPKFTSGVFNKKAGYEWTIMPIWGGIRIGGAW